MMSVTLVYSIMDNITYNNIILYSCRASILRSLCRPLPSPLVVIFLTRFLSFRNFSYFAKSCFYFVSTQIDLWRLARDLRK